METKLEAIAEKSIVDIEGTGKMFVQYIGRKVIILLGRGKGKLENTKSVISMEVAHDNLIIGPYGKIRAKKPYELIKNFNYGKQKRNYTMVSEHLTRMGI